MIHPVAIVGAGPGDPELLTLKALRLLQQAEVVVYDRLIAADILTLVPPTATLIYAGKEQGSHHCEQSVIHTLLIEHAQAGKRVVRLKGGDPFTFGRGGEEIEALAEAAIPCDIVPGVTAAQGCAAYAGIPLTHRDLANGIQFITGHRRQDHPLDLPWASLATPTMTLVVYMGLATIGEIATQLMAHGRAGDTPVAILQNGTTPSAQCRITTLDQVGAAVQTYGCTPPVLFVIGEVVNIASPDK